MKYNKYIVSENIKNLRAEKGITAFELSEALDCSISHISQIEQGKRKMSVELLCEMAEYFETDTDSILGRSDKEQSDNGEIGFSRDVGNLESISGAIEMLSPKLREYVINNIQHLVDEAVQLQQAI